MNRTALNHSCRNIISTATWFLHLVNLLSFDYSIIVQDMHLKWVRRSVVGTPYFYTQATRRRLIDHDVLHNHRLPLQWMTASTDDRFQTNPWNRTGGDAN